MQPLRLTFLITSLRDGGIETVLLEYLQHLAEDPRYRLTLAIASYMGDLEVYRERIPKCVRVCYLVKAAPLVYVPQQRARRRLGGAIKLCDQLLANPLRRWLVQRGIQRLEAETDIFVDFDTCAYSYLRSIGRPKVAFLHFSLEQLMQQNARRMRRIGRMLPLYDRVVCISEAMRAEAEQLFPELGSRLRVLYNPKDVARLRQRASELPEDTRIQRPYLLAVERLEESQKDISTLLRAYALLRRDYGVQEQLYIIGKGGSEGELRQLAEELGIAGSVCFLGFISNPYPWIQRCRLMVHSAKFEGLPTVMIEGLLLGKLIVASDCPTGPREILAGGAAGMLVPVGDASAFASAIHRLLTDEAYARELARGAALAAGRFTFETIAPQLDELFLGLAEGKA
nr:glycosyltransferase [uncultured Porphyromonas sp.]